MTFGDWLRSQIDLRATPQMRLGQSRDGIEASLMTWSDKAPGTWFWRVEGALVTLIQYVGNND